MLMGGGAKVGPIYQTQVDYLTKLLSYNPLVSFPLNETAGAVATNASSGGSGFNGTYNANRTGWTLTNGPFGEIGKAGLFNGNIANIYSAALAAGLTPNTLSWLCWLKPVAGVWSDATTRYLWELRADTSNFMDMQVAGNGSLFWRRRGAGITSDLNNTGNTWVDWEMLGMTVNNGTSKFYPLQNGMNVPDIVTPATTGAWAGAPNATQSVIGALNSSAGTPANHYMMYWSLFNQELSQIQMADLSTNYAVLPQRTNWKQVFFDDFNGALDTNTWTAADEITGELTYYRPSNVSVTGGNLVLTLNNDGYGGKAYTGGKVTTIGKASWKYGAFEARIQMVGGLGIHPTMWMLPVSNAYGAWPASGEIDLAEFAGNHLDHISGGVHYNAYTSSYNVQNTAVTVKTVGGDLTAGFHIYRCEWTPYAFYYYYDGTLIGMQTRWCTPGYAWPAPFDQPFYLLLTTTATASNGGPPVRSFPCSMYVDWIKIYQ